MALARLEDEHAIRPINGCRVASCQAISVVSHWHISDEAFDKLVELCVDICERNGIEEINYTGDTTGNLTYHGMFDKSTACPGPYMKSRMDDLANAINAELKRG